MRELAFYVNSQERGYCYMWGGGGATCILAERFCRGKKNDLLMFLLGLLPRNVHKLWFGFVVIEEILGLPREI